MRELLKYSQLSPRPDLRFIQSSYMEFASFSAQILLVEVLNIAYMYTYMSQGRLFNSMNNTWTIVQPIRPNAGPDGDGLFV